MSGSKAKYTEPQSEILYMRNLLGFHLRRIREGAGLSIREMERRSGIINSEISRIETGGQECRLESFVRICATLGVPCGTILDQVMFGHPHYYEEKIAAHPAIAKILKDKNEFAAFFSVNLSIFASFAAHLIRCSQPRAQARSVAYPDEALRAAFLQFAETVESVNAPADRLKMLAVLQEDPMSFLIFFKLYQHEVVRRMLSALFEGKSVPDSHMRKVLLAAMKMPAETPVWLPFVSEQLNFATTSNGPSQKTNLTNKAIPLESEAVKGQWLNLKKQIQKATADTGSKSKLAKFLGVDLTQLSKWLTDSDSAREPGAEYTLQMQAWVNDPKRQ